MIRLCCHVCIYQYRTSHIPPEASLKKWMAMTHGKRSRQETRSDRPRNAPSGQSGHGGHTRWTRVDTSTSQCNGIIDKVIYLRRAYFWPSRLSFSPSTIPPQCLTFTLYPGLRRYGNINETQIGERNSGFYTILTVVVAAIHSLLYTYTPCLKHYPSRAP